MMMGGAALAMLAVPRPTTVAVIIAIYSKIFRMAPVPKSIARMLIMGRDLTGSVIRFKRNYCPIKG
jgi:hypothetical protein